MSAQPTANQRLARQKKAQAYLSAGTATLGVAALGSKGLAVAAPKASKFATLGRAGRLKPLAQKVGGSGAKFDRAASNLSIGSAGVGGASGFNFASVQNAESKKIRKSQEHSMDFGLSAVRNGQPLEEVSKDWSEWNRKRKQKGISNGELAAAGTSAGGVGTILTGQGQTVAGNLRQIRGYNMDNESRTKKPIKAKRGVYNLGNRMERSAKLISSGEKLAARGTKTTWAGIGLVGAGAVGAKVAEHHKKKVKKSLTPEQKARAKKNAAARGTKAGAYDNLRAAGKPMGVSKAFDSEKSRLRRLEVGSGVAAAGAGALGLASAQQGVKSINGLKGAKSLPKFKAGLKTGGKAGALGAGALGSAFAADRINAFRKGSGRSYR